jgi:hypothetical protein
MIALLSLGAERAEGAWLALVTLWTRSTGRSSWALRSRLALQIGHLRGQLAQTGFDSVQALGRQRLARSAGFDGTHSLGFRLCGSSSDRAFGRALCHSSLLHERAFEIRALPLTHEVPASRKMALWGSSSPQGHRAYTTGFRQRASPPLRGSRRGACFSPGQTLPRIGGESQGGKMRSQVDMQYSAVKLRVDDSFVSALNL